MLPSRRSLPRRLGKNQPSTPPSLAPFLVDIVVRTQANTVKLSVAAGFSSYIRSCYRRWHWIHALSLGKRQGWSGSGVVGSRVDSRATALDLHASSSRH
jgi:hypothetical protein